MGFRYYYTPCYNGPKPDDVDPDTGTVYPQGNTKRPGIDTGSGPELADLPPGVSVLWYDDPQVRCVVKMPDNVPPLVNWEEKTSAEVLADYPSLPGVV